MLVGSFTPWKLQFWLIAGQPQSYPATLCLHFIAVVPAVLAPCLWWQNNRAQPQGGSVHGRALAPDVALPNTLGAAPDSCVLGLAVPQ